MTDSIRSRSHVSCIGVVTVRQRPSSLLMKVPLHAAEATLELALNKLKKQCEAASKWLQRLDAVRVEFGEPHFAEQADTDPLKHMRTATAQTLGQPPAKATSGERKRDVNVVVTAIWHIASMSAEETLVFVDRLRFESADDAGAPEPAEEVVPWTSPEEHLRAMMAQFGIPPTAGRAPQFLFIAQLSEEQLEKAYAEAFGLARRNAERLARSTGMRLGNLMSIFPTVGELEIGRSDKLLSRHRCGALLAGCSYALGEYEVVSDDPRSAEFSVKVNVHYNLEQTDTPPLEALQM